MFIDVEFDQLVLEIVDDIDCDIFLLDWQLSQMIGIDRNFLVQIFGWNKWGFYLAGQLFFIA